MKLTDYICEWLESQRCTEVFGVTGGSVVHLLHSAELNTSLNVTYTHHEQAAAFAASAATRIKDNTPAVCMVTTGPGGTNAITGLASSYLDSIPTIFISGQARSNDAKALKRVRQSGSQHLNIIEVVKPITKHAEMLDKVENIDVFLEKAERAINTGRPGPIWLDIPLEYQWAEIDIKHKTKSIVDRRYGTCKPPTRTIKALKSAKRPIFILGYGCKLARIEKKMIEILNKQQIPYVLTWNTIDFSSTKSDGNMGLLGISGTREGNLAIKYSDLVVAVGSHLSKMLTGDQLNEFAENAEEIHILDIDKSEFERFKKDRRFKCHKIDLRGMEPKDLLSTYRCEKKWVDFMKEIKKLRKYKIEEYCDSKIRPNDVNQYQCYNWISNCLKEKDNIVVDGGGNVLFSALQSLELPENTRMITGAGIGCMGSGIPESVGAYMANKQRTFCFIGDGSMQFNIQELQTIKHHRCNIIIIIFNNSGYLAIKNTQDAFFDRRFGVEGDNGLSIPNYSEICKAYSINYRSIKTRDQTEIIKEQLENNKGGPLVIEIFVPESTPLIPRGGFYKDKNGNNIRRPPWQMYPDLEEIPTLKD